MILKPVLPGITDHGALNGLADDDHAQYLLINSARSVDGQRIYVATDGVNEAYFDMLGGVLRLVVRGQVEQQW